MNQTDEAMNLTDHLTELRYRVIKALQGIIVGMGVSLYYSEHLFAIIRKPILPFLSQEGLVFTGIMDKFMAQVKVGLLGGLILTCPYWLYHLWKFISPGLYANERRYAVGFIVAGSILFMTGVCFVYFFVYPTAFEFLLKVGGDVDKPMITISDYLSFFAMTTIMFGVSFELPVILVVLALMGIVDVNFLRRQRRYAIVLMAVVAAILTPPDVVSMLMMLIPLTILYESSIFVIRFLIPARNNNLPAPIE